MPCAERRPRPALSLLVLALLMPAALAGGAGDEAGDDAASAVAIVPGTYSGAIRLPDDAEDWFRVEVPAGLGLRIEGRADADGTRACGLDVLDDTLGPIDGFRCDAGDRVIIEPSDGTPFFVRVVATPDFTAGATYDFAVDATPLPDVAVTLAHAPRTGDAALRGLLVTVTNAGDAPADAVEVRLVVSANARPAGLGSFGATSAACDVHVGGLAPGESWSRRLEVAVIGEAYASAAATHAGLPDRAPEDDAASAWLRGTPAGRGVVLGGTAC